VSPAIPNRTEGPRAGAHPVIGTTETLGELVIWDSQRSLGAGEWGYPDTINATAWTSRHAAVLSVGNDETGRSVRQAVHGWPEGASPAPGAQARGNRG